LIKTHGFLHITISVTDLDRATAFYRDLLGCELVRRARRMAFMKSGEHLFVLTRMENHVRPNPPGRLDIETTLFHHALLVAPDEFDRAIAHLDEKGVEYLDCTDHGHPTVPGRRHVYIMDPDGNSIELATMLEAEMARVDR
jgi:glyoxylase I family protein